MKIGIMADSHDNIEKTKAAVAAFADRDVEYLIHCGDIISPLSTDDWEVLA